jgi:hypothetical protein
VISRSGGGTRDVPAGLPRLETSPTRTDSDSHHDDGDGSVAGSGLPGVLATTMTHRNL